jgi:DNA-binding NarL/FixJ family response regulator
MREELIEKYYSLVPGVVNRFLWLMPDVRNWRDQLLSEGGLAVVEAVDNLLKRPIENGAPYVKKAIWRACSRFAKKQRKQRMASAVEFYEKSDHIAEANERMDKPSIVLTVEIYSHCRTDEEREVIRALSRGKKVGHVARKLELTVQQVKTIRQRIRRRYEQIEQLHKKEAA